MSFVRIGVRFLLVLLVVFLPGCAGTPGNLLEDEAGELKARSQARWEALIQKDWDAAYQYELPVYRQSHDVTQFRARFGAKVQWKRIEAKNAVLKSDAKTADVQLLLTYTLAMSDGVPMETVTEINERWLKQEGKWWIVN